MCCLCVKSGTGLANSGSEPFERRMLRHPRHRERTNLHLQPEYIVLLWETRVIAADAIYASPPQPALGHSPRGSEERKRFESAPCLLSGKTCPESDGDREERLRGFRGISFFDHFFDRQTSILTRP